MPDDQMPRAEQELRFGFCFDDIGGFGAFHDFHSFSQKVINHAPLGAIIVEVGSYMGRSIVCLGLMAREANRRDLRIYAVDDSNIGGNPHLLENLAKAELGDWVGVIEKPSLEAAKGFADESCWLVFLDDDHRHEQVEAGCRAWMPKIQIFGWLSGHDALWHSVAQPVHALFGVENVITEHEDIWIVPKMTPRDGVDIHADSYRPEVIMGSWKP